MPRHLPQPLDAAVLVFRIPRKAHSLGSPSLRLEVSRRRQILGLREQ
jgi:hypothetical protein